MANTTIWRGQSATLTIGQIQTATKKHISKYVFYDSSNELAGTSEQNSYSTAIEAQYSVNSSKDYTITSYLLYSHKFAGGTVYATSNKVDNTLTVHEPLDATSLTKIEPRTTDLIHDWVWSNAQTATFAITPTFASNQPWSKRGIITSDSTDPAAKKGYTSTLNSEDISTNNELTWTKTTGSTTDLGEPSQNITVFVKSIAESAPTPGRIERRNATFVVRNAVTALGGLANQTLYAGSDAVTETVSITPANPYSKALVLVKGNQDAGNSITGAGGAKVTLDGQTITFDASAVKAGTATQTIIFKVRSYQTNGSIDTKEITFTVNAVTDITGKTVTEGQSITVAAGIGDITSAVARPGDPVRVEHSAGSVTITGTAVDDNTPWVVTVTNAAGAHITISGTTTRLADVSASINTGDYIIIGTEILTGLTTNFEIASGPTAGKASIEGGKLKYEASTTNGPIAAGTYKIKVKGANGATQTVNISVSNITATLS